ncbi:aromatic amino acid lyase [Actinoplanes xinjiangensis]|uniref:Histidine ammonia-lyase n=1 Tax=Actinoplanes xinjiangensis TaxID=512350 RepID=A0A316EI70_9ACTN|nr:aromatic amino acid lyase [Actinoplanes xinjiangensis]PWK30463.1 histidine ammonia-lyase [Actinoplanes xinjiangensis]GIF44506.1 histidine ammonia-lyase [Actinoplanes xinjiangensis]
MQVRLDGRSLTVPELETIASGATGITVDPAALTLVDERHTGLREAQARGAVYGANTGVGANRHEQAGDPDGHALRLLLSHCAGVGPEEDDRTARAVMAVRLNQLLAGGSGVSRRTTEALAAAVRAGAVPTLHRWGAIGTSDLSALAELALTLAGARPWRSGTAPAVELDATDALPMISSSALTVATSALAVSDVHRHLRASTIIAALSFLALRGNPEAYDPAVHAARPHPHQIAVAETLHTLVDGASPALRIQDPFGLRVVPQVTAPALHATETLTAAVTAELNAAVENPLITADGVHHHGQFHTAALAAGLDAVRGAFLPVMSLSAARLGLLMRPDMTGLRAFLADGPPGSSGLMITEYVVQDLLAEMRAAVQPTASGTLTISLGLEEHASFATQGARSLRTMTRLTPTLLAAELVAAVRALRLSPERLTTGTLRDAYDLAADALSPDLTDRPLDTDLTGAAALLPTLAALL